MRRGWGPFAALLVGLGALGWGAGRLPDAYENDLARPYLHRESDWAGSSSCRSCHPDHHASWYRTFHRTMTQEATPAAVQGAFDGREVTFFGVTARPVRRGGGFYVEYLNEDGQPFRTLRVRRTVGSRRYQQYLVDDPVEGGGNLYRIPLLWHIGERRWIHLNGAFLGPDSDNYDQHLTLWNQNCIFCHNTGPRPGSTNYDELRARTRAGEPVSAAFDGRYESSVAELGISCESCHAPAAEHARRNRDPLRRYLLYLTARRDPTVVHPAKLPKQEAADVCGQCHGQRLPEPLASTREWLTDGPLYRPGERLAESARAVFHDTPAPGGDPGFFRLRFWRDGTPRLTAHEYQGLLLSPCFQRGELTCASCHSMHEGDVRGQLTPEMRTNQACASCHEELVADVAAHSHHEPESSGSSCYECHMPKVVYGILEIHRSHRIESPDPARDAAAGRPNACTGCHLDRSLLWAAERAREWWGERYEPPVAELSRAPVEMAAAASELLAGDPVQRAVAARLAGRSGTPLDPAERAFLLPLLIEGLADDYPTIRWFSRGSLLALLEEIQVPGLAPLVEEFDYLAPAADRARLVARLATVWSAAAKAGLPEPPPGSILDAAYLPRRAYVEALQALRPTDRITIGE